MKRFCIKTLGCKVNQYEAQVIREGFLRQGYVEAANVDDADIFVVNSCTVTSASDSKSLKAIRSAIKKGKCVVATGCMIEDRDLDLSKLIGARFIVKNRDKHRIPQIIEGEGCPSTSLGTGRVKGEEVGINGLKGHTRVFVKIQDGCDNVCSYCKVRVVRGRSKSRPLKEVAGECRRLIESGVKEIVLTGICLGAYGRDISKTASLPRLVKEICRIDGDWRLRLSSIEPKDITKDLILLLQEEKRFCKHLHIPFQSGDDYILRKMARPYSRSDYLDIVKRVRKAIPDIAISTDIMVGFPGETEERFQNTVDFIELVRPMRMHVFPFSRRKGTRACDYKDGVSSLAKKEKEDRLLNIAKKYSAEFIERSAAGGEVRVLVEDKKTSHGYLQGYTSHYIKVYIDGPDSLKGRFVNCQPTELPVYLDK
ncbi:MAG: tRNA (N(6)-L-threonylcarbamoyladenosine(37)-C(2))-methylthiotransferase MtaB [Candidatus Omnitrophica bacterium]|nr:tRNA (N(6)-L-threonylcarbamoyladenosine(37)-C(2))-methylthiotransferase MtaB [Candidatus Omnitrophota bacterium]MBU4590905.1 tRNA (N(6)-L-threonylcarbamoyladenosine(37)-C(2))-methylthiotransferase MtaB [Candidatus Omnitrophota bacterium]